MSLGTRKVNCETPTVTKAVEHDIGDDLRELATLIGIGFLRPALIPSAAFEMHFVGNHINDRACR